MNPRDLSPRERGVLRHGMRIRLVWAYGLAWRLQTRTCIGSLREAIAECGSLGPRGPLS